jgi:phosphoglycolate phosphatase
MALKIPELVLVDLDGTLIDSVPDLAYAVDGMMAQLDLPLRGEDKVRDWVGNGVERLVKRALLDKLDGEPDSELFNKAMHLFDIFYTDCNGRYSRVFPGVRKGLNWLKSQGAILVCITNKAEKFTIPLLEALDLHHYFRIILSGDSLPKKKPDPLPLLHAAKKFKIKPSHSLLLGDSMTDVKAARAAGFDVICVSYGYNHGQDINLAKPDAVIDSFIDLPSLFEK